MKQRLSAVPSSVIAIAVGLITLLGLLLGDAAGPLMPVSEQALPLRAAAGLFVRITVVAVALTIVIGVLNLLRVHLRRIVRREGGGPHSIVLLLVFILAVIIRAVDTAAGSNLSAYLLEDIQIPIESALAGLLFFSLVYGAYRLMHREVSLLRVLFLISLLIVLLGALPGINGAAELSAWWMSVPVSAGGRGILLGIGLATVVLGIRSLTGQDRSYRE